MNSNGPKHAKFIDFYFEIHLLETDVQKQKQAFSIFDLILSRFLSKESLIKR